METTSIDLTILKRIPNLSESAILEITPLAPLSMVSEYPGAFYKTLSTPSKNMLCGLLENLLGWHFSDKVRKEIFSDYKKSRAKQKIKINESDYKNGSTYLPLLNDYFEIAGNTQYEDFKGISFYVDYWSRYYRRGDSSKHLNGCRNISIDIIAEKHLVFKSATKEAKEDWFKRNKGSVPLFYTTPTKREYVNIDAKITIPLTIDPDLLSLILNTSDNLGYLGNNEGWIHFTIRQI